jgi:hypothetical protein
MPNRTKNPKAGDYVEILVPLGKDDEGNTTYEKGLVLRASMSDEKWNDVKGRAERSGRLSTVKDSEGGRTLTDEQDVSGDHIKFKDKSGASVIVLRGDLDDAAWQKRIDSAADKDSFESAVQGGSVVKAGPRRAKETGTNDLGDKSVEGPVQQAERKPLEVVTPKLVGGIDEPAQDVVKAKVTEVPSAVPGATQSHRTISGSGVTLTPEDEPQASGPRKFFGDAMMGSLPGGVGGGEAPMSMPAPGPGAPTSDGGVSSFTDGGVMPAPNQSLAPSPIGVSGGAAPDAGVPAPSAGLSSPPPDASSGPMPNMSFGDRQPLTNPVDLAVASTLPQASGSAPMSGGQSQTPPGAPAPAPQPTSTSVGVKFRGGPSSAPGGVPSLDQAEKDFRAGQQKMVDTEQKAATERLAARADYESRVSAFEAEQKAATIRQRENEDRINSAYLQTLEDVSKKAEIDPDHFWNSKSDGQKAMMAIGGFLAGLGGRDPSARIDQMIARDIAVQRENFNLAREGAKNKLAGLNTMYGRLRERGLDDREAAAAARAAMNQGMANKLEGIKEQMAPGEAMAKMDMAIAQFRMNKVKAQDDLLNSASERQARIDARKFQEFNMEMKRKEAEAKAAGGGKEESPGTRSQIAQIDQALDAVDRLLSDSSKVGAFQQFADAQTQVIRGILPESAEKLFDQMFPSVAQREARAGEVGQTAKKAVTGEAMGVEERKEAARAVPRPGVTQNQDAAVRELRQQLLAKRKSLENTRFSVGTAPTQGTSFEEQSGP